MGVKKEIRVDDIGVNVQGEPKVFIGTRFDIVEPDGREQLRKDYRNQLDKLF